MLLHGMRSNCVIGTPSASGWQCPRRRLSGTTHLPPGRSNVTICAFRDSSSSSGGSGTHRQPLTLPRAAPPQPATAPLPADRGVTPVTVQQLTLNSSVEEVVRAAVAQMGRQYGSREKDLVTTLEEDYYDSVAALAELKEDKLSELSKQWGAPLRLLNLVHSSCVAAAVLQPTPAAGPESVDVDEEDVGDEDGRQPGVEEGVEEGRGGMGRQGAVALHDLRGPSRADRAAPGLPREEAAEPSAAEPEPLTSPSHAPARIPALAAEAAAVAAAVAAAAARATSPARAAAAARAAGSGGDSSGEDVVGAALRDSVSEVEEQGEELGDEVEEEAEGELGTWDDGSGEDLPGPGPGLAEPPLDLAATPLMERRCPDKFRFGHGSGRSVRLTDRARKEPYAITVSTAAPALAAELCEFEAFCLNGSFEGAQHGEPLRRATVNGYVQCVRQAMGWLHSVEGVAAEELRLGLLIPGTQRQAAKKVHAFLMWQERERGMCKRSVSRSLAALIQAAKFLFHEQTQVSEGDKPYSDVEVIKTMRVMYMSYERATRVSGHVVDPAAKWLDWPAYLAYVAELRRECAGLRLDGRPRSVVDVAMSLQAYLLAAILSCVPDRQRTLRELVVGRTLVQDKSGAWSIRHTHADYKTGGTYGERPPLLIDPGLYYELEEFIHTWRAHLNPQHNNLFSMRDGSAPLSSQELSRSFSLNAYRLTGRKLNPHMVRDMVVTYARSGHASEHELEALAVYMGHSLAEQRGTYDRRTKAQKVQPALGLLAKISGGAATAAGVAAGAAAGVAAAAAVAAAGGSAGVAVAAAGIGRGGKKVAAATAGAAAAVSASAGADPVPAAAQTAPRKSRARVVGRSSDVASTAAPAVQVPGGSEGVPAESSSKTAGRTPRRKGGAVAAAAGPPPEAAKAPVVMEAPGGGGAAAVVAINIVIGRGASSGDAASSADGAAAVPAAVDSSAGAERRKAPRTGGRTSGKATAREKVPQEAQL